MMKDQFVELGKRRWQDTDGSNIPVGIYLIPRKDDDRRYSMKKYPYELGASNYITLRCLGGDKIEKFAYCAYGTKEQLQELLKIHALPLFQTAAATLNSMATGEKTPKGHIWGNLCWKD
jgi:hypothetical protein